MEAALVERPPVLNTVRAEPMIRDPGSSHCVVMSQMLAETISKPFLIKFCLNTLTFWTMLPELFAMIFMVTKN